MKKFNRLQLRQLKKETLEKRKLEHRKLKKTFKKAMLNIATKSIGLELENNIEKSPQNVLNYLDFADK